MKIGTSGVGLIDIFKDAGPIIGLEIGVFNGLNASNLLRNLPNLTLHGIDPYQTYDDWCGAIDNSVLTEAENTAVEYTQLYKDRFISHKKTSDAAVHSFNDNYFDFIFIDGRHDYEQVLNDCINYYPKVKPGGIFSGHDYLQHIGGVVQAVNEFALKINKSIELMETSSWKIVK